MKKIRDRVEKNNKTDPKEWLDENIEGKSLHDISDEDFDRLVRMARKSFFRKATNIVDDSLIESLKAKVERYEKAVLEIKYEIRDSDRLLREHGLDNVLSILDSALEDKE